MLSDEEIDEFANEHGMWGYARDIRDFARDIEKAVLAKVASDRQQDASDWPLEVGDVVVEEEKEDYVFSSKEVEYIVKNYEQQIKDQEEKLAEKLLLWQ